MKLMIYVTMPLTLTLSEINVMNGYMPFEHFRDSKLSESELRLKIMRHCLMF